MSTSNRQQQSHEFHTREMEIVLPFAAIDHTSLPSVGGKGANLGELTHAGLPVPPGFCVTTAAYELVVEGADLAAILTRLASTPAANTTYLTELAAAARTSLLVAPVPTIITTAIIEAYRALGDGEPVAVAVRSSATAEDLPFASFAGQQDTYLNVVGEDAVLDAVKRCWASLWTDRAVSYRASNGIDHRSVRLAVVVQRMVEASVAGVLFTANPLSGRRRQAVIDASPGLGEAVVSGAVNPDHFVVNTTTGEIIEQRLGDKRLIIQARPGGGTQRIEKAEPGDAPCLSQAQLRALAQLGARVEAHYGAPQDTEWAIDSSGQLWLTQARPITTLFPLPPDAPTTDDILRVYFSLSVAQGVYRPFTPMGIQMFRLMFSSVATFIGKPPRDPRTGPPIFKEAAYRLFADVTPALRSTFGRNVVGRMLQIMETRTAAIFAQLANDPRLAPLPVVRWSLARTFLRVLVRMKAPLYIAQALLRPAAARKRLASLEEQIRIQSHVPAGASSTERLALLERLSLVARILSSVIPVLATGLISYMLASKLLQGLATPDEVQTVLRSLPYNPTTEMDLSLWSLTQKLHSDPVAMRRISETPPSQLVREYREGLLPPVLQQELADFLNVYGHRGVAEIDLGLPRWSEDPTHIFGVIANYLQLTKPELAPTIQFQRGAQEAEAMLLKLTQRAKRKGLLRGMLVGFCLRRTRDLAGLRELPKFYLVLVLARAREILWPVGEELAQVGRLDTAADIFFVTLPEAYAALSGTDLRAIVSERHASYEQELRRRHIPRVLLSDGTEPTADIHPSAEGSLKGAPASAGRVTAKARVILDPTGAHLEPGEILVAPSTDPGWTPLFLTAGGLVMEMGGPMSHGSIVAREYGIPAVVAVPQATERITTGQLITVDGSAGTVLIETEAH
ncbi:MAG: PEP/pyruvate-binding domain-containing protein [Ktedonobacteraceae bacterium]